MRTITVDNKDYVLEYSFDAAEQKGLIQRMFNMLSGAYLMKRSTMSELDSGDFGGMEIGSLVDGAAEMASEIPQTCVIAFHAGLLENNPLPKDESKQLMKQYMKANKLSFNALYEELKAIMEEDGFFDLCGLTEMLSRMNEPEEEDQKQKKNEQKKEKK